VGFNAFLYLVCMYVNRVRRAPSLNERQSDEARRTRSSSFSLLNPLSALRMASTAYNVRLKHRVVRMRSVFLYRVSYNYFSTRYYIVRVKCPSLHKNHATNKLG